MVCGFLFLWRVPASLCVLKGCLIALVLLIELAEVGEHLPDFFGVGCLVIAVVPVLLILWKRDEVGRLGDAGLREVSHAVVHRPEGVLAYHHPCLVLTAPVS